MIGKIFFVFGVVLLACCVAILSWFGWMHGISWSQRRTSFPNHG